MEGIVILVNWVKYFKKVCKNLSKYPGILKQFIKCMLDFTYRKRYLIPNAGLITNLDDNAETIFQQRLASCLGNHFVQWIY